MSMWEQESIVGFAADGTPRVMPMTSAIGNHDVGGYGIRHESVPNFFRFFAFSDRDVTDWMPGDAQARTFHSHVAGDLLRFLVLDTDQVASAGPDGPQFPWLLKQLRDATERFRFAEYHVPLFPSRRDPLTPKSVKLRRLWLDRFTGGGIHLGLENHDHAYKRTYHMAAATGSPGYRRDPTNTSTVFVGDGMWGTPPQELHAGRAQLRDYDVLVHDTQFILHVVANFSSGTVRVRAVNEHAEPLDDFVLSL
jgi:hypothetical protein